LRRTPDGNASLSIGKPLLANSAKNVIEINACIPTIGSLQVELTILKEAPEHLFYVAQTTTETTIDSLSLHYGCYNKCGK